MQYLFNRNIDLTLLYLPLLLLWCSFPLLPEKIIEQDLSLAVWMVFVLGIDVAHVWSTLFRTYFSKSEFNAHKTFLIWGPLVLFILTFGVVYWSVSLFWSLLAYIAVYHFIKQQYGFLALYRYRTKSALKAKGKYLDKALIYGATGIPVLLWHFNPKTQLSWFVEGDFMNLKMSEEHYQMWVWILCLTFLAYLIFWLIINIKQKALRVGVALWVGFTILNWFGAIVFLNSDFVFTTTNVVAHGIPYFTLMAFYKAKTDVVERRYNFVKWIVIIVFTVLVFAFVEEYFWDTLLFEEKPELFGKSWQMHANENVGLRALFFALLALPQLWHYFADGLIWKANDKTHL